MPMPFDKEKTFNLSRNTSTISPIRDRLRDRSPAVNNSFMNIFNQCKSPFLRNKSPIIKRNNMNINANNITNDNIFNLNVNTNVNNGYNGYKSPLMKNSIIMKSPLKSTSKLNLSTFDDT